MHKKHNDDVPPVYTIDHPFVRSIYNLGDYEDSEHNTDPSLTDPSQDEPIEKLVARLMRGEFQANGVPVFDDIKEGMSVDQAVAQMDPSMVKGFDLADVPVVMSAAEAAAKAAAPASVTPAPVPPVVATPVSAPVLPEQRKE